MADDHNAHVSPARIETALDDIDGWRIMAAWRLAEELDHALRYPDA